MDSLTFLIVSGLATWRMSSLLADETGPFDVFVKLRELTGIKHDPDKKVWIIPETFFAQVISCVWCNSIYFGVFWAVFYYLFPVLALYIAFPLAISATAILASKK